MYIKLTIGFGVLFIIILSILMLWPKKKSSKNQGCQVCGLTCTCGKTGKCDVCKREQFHFEGMKHDEENFDLESGYSQSYLIKTKKF